MKKITILGAGRVGSAIAFDLSNEYEIIIVDNYDEHLNQVRRLTNIFTLKGDLLNNNLLKDAIKDSDLVIGAVPGFIGYKILEEVIKSGKNIVDISFFNENPFELDELAKKNNVTAVVDCGISPGASNIILGFHNSRMQIENYECFVGGLPFKRILPFQYKASFSPVDVIEEYIRPARFIRNGDLIIKDALTDLEFVEIDPVGTLEAFNTDGLRTLLKTMKIKNMIEKTLRYPGHVENMLLFREAGFFSKESVEVNGKIIRPFDLTAKLLFPKWHLEKNEEEFTILQMKISGKEDGIIKEYKYELFDRYDKDSELSSMARTTGFTCAAVARLVVEEKFIDKGIIPPEYIGVDGKCYRTIIKDLEEHGITFKLMEKKL